MPYFTHIASAGGSLILDTVSGAVGAWSVRKLLSSYSGFAMTIRRDSDNAETDVSFDGSDEVSGSSTVSAGGDLTTWAGADLLFVKTLYDQLELHDLSNTTAAQQPQLFLGAGPNSKAYISADINRHLEKTVADPYSTHTEGTMFTVLQNQTFNFSFNSADAATTSFYFALSGARDPARNDAIGIFKVGGGNSLIYGNTDVVDGAWHYEMWASNGTAYEMRSDGINQTINILAGSNNGDWFGDVANRDNLSIGKVLWSGGLAQVTLFTEFIYFNPDLSTADKNTVEADISTFYAL